MDSEASVVARKIQNFIHIENQEVSVKKSEPGFMSHLLMVSLMGLAVIFTQITLVLVKWAKALES